MKLFCCLLAFVSCLVSCASKRTDTLSDRFPDLSWRGLRLIDPNTLIPLSNAGDREATFVLYRYYDSLGGQNHKRAMAYLRQSAEAGLPIAQCDYYVRLAGSKIASDRQEALSWLIKAKEQGYKPAQSLFEIHDEVHGATRL